MLKIGIIGGSGLDDPRILKNAKEISVETPYGNPSSALTAGKIAGIDVLLLARHGKGHILSPSQINYRANISALKAQGLTHILATTACGSLREEIQRGDFVILDQFIDFTKHRKNTFYESFENGIQHPIVADPFDAELRSILYETSLELGFRTHKKGTVVTIEGPRFSTRAESKMFRIWGADVINMSVATEVTLAREAGIPYGVVAMSTDYDCWKEDETVVTWQEILEVFAKNSDNVKKLLIHAVEKMGSGVRG